MAFALFIFAEYIRYFAVYPFGAAVHVFLTEFLDHKDSGTAILSHFYLLTGCAVSVWIERYVNLSAGVLPSLNRTLSPSRILEFTGLLVLGVGDAMVHFFSSFLRED